MQGLRGEIPLILLGAVVPSVVHDVHSFRSVCVGEEQLQLGSSLLHVRFRVVPDAQLLGVQGVHEVQVVRQYGVAGEGIMLQLSHASSIDYQPTRPIVDVIDGYFAVASKTN